MSAAEEIEPTTDYGVVLETADPTAEPDDIVLYSEDLEHASLAAVEQLTKGVRSAIVFRVEGEEWVTLYTRQTPGEWIEGMRRARARA